MMCGLLNNTFHNDTMNNSLDYIKQLEIVNNKGRYTLNGNRLDSKTLKVIKSTPIYDRFYFDADNDPLNNEFVLTTFSKNELFDWFFKFFSPK
tara:strand:+ start:2445 stop:2723 length:279 start_codon:yes stop_codon:yes gene_type:complete